MTRLELENLVADWLNDPNKTYYTATKIQTWLNLALRMLQVRLVDAQKDLYTGCATTSLVVNQGRYRLPSDFLGIRRLEIIMSGSGDTAQRRKLEPMTMNDQDQFNNSTGEPSHYYIVKNHLYLKQVPSAVRTLEMQYIYRVGEMTTDGSVPDVPIEFHEYIAILAAETGSIKDNSDISSLLNKKDFFEKQISLLIANRNSDGSRTIRSRG